MTDYAKKTFSVPVKSGTADPKDFEDRWRATFGEPCPARHRTGVECKLKRGHMELHTDGVVSWEET